MGVRGPRAKNPVGLPPAVGCSRPKALVRVEYALELRVLPLGLAEDSPFVAQRVGFHACPPQELRVDVRVVGDVADVEDAQEGVFRQGRKSATLTFHPWPRAVPTRKPRPAGPDTSFRSASRRSSTD